MKHPEHLVLILGDQLDLNRRFYPADIRLARVCAWYVLLFNGDGKFCVIGRNSAAGSM